MRFISGGTFLMGSVDTNFPNAQPVHQVAISAFYIDTTEVTQDEYLLLMKCNPSGFIKEAHPVENLTWYDAILFCNARSIRDHRDTVYMYNSIVGRNDRGNVIGLWGLSCDMKKNGYRLPTEAEFEYACRSGTTTDYYWGRNYPPKTSADSLAIDSNTVWYYNSAGSTEPVATKKPNAWGLYDMSGNLWEWCNDGYGSYGASSQTNPTGAMSGDFRVLRGGSWSDGFPLRLCAGYRYFNDPGAWYSNLGAVGFRVVCVAQ